MSRLHDEKFFLRNNGVRQIFTEYKKNKKSLWQRLIEKIFRVHKTPSLR